MGGCRSQLSNSNSSKVMKVSESKLPDRCPFCLYRGEHESVKRKLQIASVFLAGSTYENGYHRHFLQRDSGNRVRLTTPYYMM